jgi:hypothetical protein
MIFMIILAQPLIQPDFRVPGGTVLLSLAAGLLGSGLVGLRRMLRP